MALQLAFPWLGGWGNRDTARQEECNIMKMTPLLCSNSSPTSAVTSTATRAAVGHRPNTAIIPDEERLLRTCSGGLQALGVFGMNVCGQLFPSNLFQ